MPISSAIWRQPGSVAESALAALGVDQRERLAALGYELLSLRADNPLAANAGTKGLGPRSMASTAVESQPRLVLHVGDATPFSGAHSTLLRALVAALSLREHEVTTSAIANVPTLALGVPAGVDAVALPTPDQLRDAHAKRDLWPVIRRLRRQLLQAEVRSG